MFRRIVCPTDFSAPAHRAAEYAVRLAKSCGAEVILLHVLAELSYPMRSLGTVTAFPNLRTELHNRAKEELAEARTKLDPDVSIRTEMRDGEVHEQILDCAKTGDADLIVIGTHGHTGFHHTRLRSIAERVVRTSETPVLTVRTTED